MTHTSLCKALLPIITECYFANRQKLEKGESMEMVTTQVANEAMKLRPTATPQELGEAFRKGAGGDYETDGRPPYLTPNRFRYFIKAYYEQKQTVNAQQEEEDMTYALPYFSSWEERQVYHISERYGQMLRGWRIMMFDSDNLFRFLTKKGFASEYDIANAVLVQRAIDKIANMSSTKDAFGIMGKVVEQMIGDYDRQAQMAKWIYIEDLMKSWISQGLSKDDVINMLRN